MPQHDGALRHGDLARLFFTAFIFLVVLTAIAEARSVAADGGGGVAGSQQVIALSAAAPKEPVLDLLPPDADSEQPGSYYVLSMAMGYKATELCAFLKSWQLFEPSTQLVLFVASQVDRNELLATYRGVPLQVRLWVACRAFARLHVLARPHGASGGGWNQARPHASMRTVTCSAMQHRGWSFHPPPSMHARPRALAWRLQRVCNTSHVQIHRATATALQVYVLAPWDSHAVQVTQWRHHVFAQYLASRAHLARGVMLADSRDLVFNAPLWRRPEVRAGRGGAVSRLLCAK